MKKEIETTNIDVRLSAIEPKLPNGIKKHIRKLKEEGKLSEAIKFRQREIEKKRLVKD